MVLHHLPILVDMTVRCEEQCHLAKHEDFVLVVDCVVTLPDFAGGRANVKYCLTYESMTSTRMSITRDNAVPILYSERIGHFIVTLMLHRQVGKLTDSLVQLVQSERDADVQLIKSLPALTLEPSELMDE